MRVLSLFSGIGGFDLGFDITGLVTDAFCEINPNCQRVLHQHFAHVDLISDVRDVDGKWFKAIDVICGGFPCIDVSLAGERRGLAGEQSGLWFEFARVVSESRPTWVVVENVVGLLSQGAGRDMGVVVGALADMGYGWAYRVLDAQGWGVAQQRRRVFIVAHLSSVERAAQVLFDGESVSPDARGGRTQLPGDSDVFAFQTRFARCGRGAPSLVCSSLNGTETGMHADSQPHVWDGQVLRRLMPVEVERLMGFPDGWTDCGDSDPVRYRMLGNSVVVPVVTWLGKRLLKVNGAL